MKHAIVFVFLLAVIIGRSQVDNKEKQALITIGKYSKIFDQSIGEKETWYINDHCFIKGPEGKWHVFGIIGMDAPNKWDEGLFNHAVADDLNGKWEKKPNALDRRADLNETVLWAPHIIKQGDTYYMYYCGGDPDHRRYQINLATSRDLYEWTRYNGNPLFVDGFDGRDPYLFRDEFNSRWILYYTATSKPEGGQHIVAAKTSTDLVHWAKDRYVVFRDTAKGTWGGNTESPQIIQRGDWYYLFIGPGANYRTTKVYRSNDLFNWDLSDEVATLDSHAAELVIDNDGKWYISSCGLQQGGLYLAPFYWHDYVEEKLKGK
jgi:beta-fructofuranosidase